MAEKTPQAQDKLYEPRYLALYRSGELQKRYEQACELAKKCVCCGRRCEADRTGKDPKQWGKCHTGMRAVVSSYNPHHGEEAFLSGTQGSGTIFFSNCNLECQYCQNFEISQAAEGRLVTNEQLAGMMLELQHMGCHNINFVSPTHVLAPILGALCVAVAKGLRLPLVWNTGGYDSMETIRLLDGVVDIYMPDAKYADPKIGLKLSRVKEYPAVNQAAIKEMHRQVGDLEVDHHGIATHGLLVRHLVLPNGLAGTEQIVDFLANEVSKNTCINVMAQYHPEFNAADIPEISRRPTRQEVKHARELAVKAGLRLAEGVSARGRVLCNDINDW